MKIAIIHEWLVTYVGSERVVEQILNLYPDADFFCLFDFLPNNERDFIRNRKIHTSFLQKMPFAKRWYRNYLPIMPFAIERFDLSGYDLLISSSHAVAKGIKKNPHQLHICYCHTPMRYAWDLQRQYLKESGLDKGIKGVLVKAILNRIKKWDVATSRKVDYFIANSHYIKNRIKRIYEREATVIYPPVDIKNFQVNDKKENFFLTVSRMVPYKRVDLIVKAFSKIGLPLIVIGDGPDFSKIKKIAKKNVEFLGYQKGEVLREYMQKAKAFVFAAEEDFGIVPVEAQACGTPVIAYGRGGVTETVIPFGESAAPTGIFFYEQTPQAIIDALKKFKTIEDKFNPHEIRKNVERFNIERFKREFKKFVDEKMKEFFG
jgi:glycosyltransferase involved in cell wall biosynthesis